MTAAELCGRLRHQLQAGQPIWLFLDYDGTLVPLAPTPDEAVPDRDLLELLTSLARQVQLRVAIVSGRSLATLQAFLPIPNLMLAGLYGAEMLFPGRPAAVVRAPPGARQVADEVRQGWETLVAGRPGFLVENKGLATALHARSAHAAEAELVLARAWALAKDCLPATGYRFWGDERFLEVAPMAAHKGQTVNWLLNNWPWPNALPVYFGDDDKDELAFDVIQARGGLTVGVGPRPLAPTSAQLLSPHEVRPILQLLV